MNQDIQCTEAIASLKEDLLNAEDREVEKNIEIPFIDILVTISNQSFEVTKRIFKNVDMDFQKKSPYAKKKLLFDITKDVFDSSIDITRDTLNRFAKIFPRYLESENGLMIREQMYEFLEEEINEFIEKSTVN